MKLAPWTALAAVAVFLGITATAWKVEFEDQVVALDFNGIDELEVAAPEADVYLGSDKPASARLDASAFGDVDESPRITVRRKEHTLRISLEDADGSELTVYAPTHVRRLVMLGGRAKAVVPVGDIEVRTTRDLEWKGDARSLRIFEVGPVNEQDCHDGEPTAIGIDAGEIAQLFVHTVDGRVLLRPDLRAARTTLELGPDAHFSVHHVRMLPPLVLEDLPAGPCPPPTQDEGEDN